MQNNFSKCREWVPRGTSQHKWRWFTTLLLILTLGIGQMWADVIFESDLKANVTNATYNMDGGSFVTSSLPSFAGSYANAWTNGSSSNKKITYTFSPAIDLSNYTDVTITIYYGSSSSRPCKVGINTTTTTQIGTTSGNTSKLLNSSTEITATSINSLTFQSASGSGMYFFHFTIAGTPDGGTTCSETAPAGATVSGGNTYTKGDALTNLTATTTAGTNLTYQWYRNTENTATVSNDLKLENCTTATLTPSNKVGTYYYYCVASNCAGSVTSGTTSVTINADCSATGDIFTLTMNSKNAPTSEVKTPASSTMNIDKYINIDGGDIVLVTGSSQHSSITTTPRIKLGGSSGYAQITLDCPLQEGDKITFEKTNKIALAADASGTNKIQLASSTNEYTITKEDCLYNQSNLFILRDGNNVEISSITITRPVMRTISFDSNGGSAVTAIKVEDGTAATKPADPTWEHHRFDGWYDGSDPYDWSETVGGDLTLTAHWTQLYTVTYAAGDGTATGDAPTQADLAAGEKFNVAANTFAVAGKDFVKWNDGTSDYNPGQEYTMGSANVTLTAQWKAASAKYTVHYMDEDGTTPLAADELVEVTQKPAGLAEDPTKPLYTFAAWQLSGVDIALDAASWTSVAANTEVTLTARWTKAYAADIDFEAFIDANGTSGNWQNYLSTNNYAISNTADVSLDNQGTSKPADKGLKMKNHPGAYVSFNVNAGKLVLVKMGRVNGMDASVDGGANYAALNGSGSSEGASVVNYLYNASEAEYRLKTTVNGYNIIQSITITDPYQVSFNTHGADAIAAATFTGTEIILPTPTNGTGSFKGWYDAETEGNKIGNAGASYTPTANITLHAQWETLSSDNTLASWKIDGVAKDVPVSRILYIEEPYGVTPVISEPVATANVGLETPIAEVLYSNTPVHYQSATEDFWYVQAEVHPQDPNAAIGYYQVRYTNAPKLGATIFRADLTAENAADFSGMYVDADNSQVALKKDGDNNNEYKFAGTSNFIKMALADATFAEGDMLKMNYSTNPQQAELAIYDGTTKLQGTPYTNHTMTFTDVVNGKSTLFIRRTNDNTFNGWVAAVEVQRYMNPIIKSFKIGAVSGTIDQDLKTISIELPYGTSLYGVAATIEAYANGGATVIAPTPLAYDTPLGYKVSSAYAEDGDVDYTVTITEAEHYEAMIVGGANYETLAAAVAAAQADDVVKLLDNVDLMATGLTIAENITLDLNGFNIKAGEQLTNNINVPAGVKLTLVDNSANAEGKIYTEEAYAGANTGYGVIRVAGEFLMQSGNIYAVIESDPANLGQFAVVLGAGGKATIEGGQIKAGWYAISNNGNNTGSTIIVSGGELISTADFAIYNPAKESTVTVSGGVVYGAAGGIAMNRGELTVTGGTITSKDQGTTGTWGDGTGGLSNAAISASGKYESVEVEISGGTIIAEGTAVMIANGTTNPVEVAISGGQFSHVVPAEYCAEGFAPVTEPNAQGKYEVEDKRIYIFNGTTSSATMATSPSGAIAWEIVGSTMGATDKSGTYDEVSYVKALQSTNSSTSKHFRIDVALNNNAKIEVIGMSNSNSGDSKIRHAWLTNSTDKGEIANAIASLESDGYNPEYFATDWLEEGSYYLHSDNTVNIFLIRVTPKAVDPKCEVPTITTQPATDLTFGAGNMTATVEAEVSDGGTLNYQWYNADGDVAVAGQTNATLTTAVEGTYYVIVTNTLDNHRDNSIKSAEATLAHRVMNDATLSALSVSAGTLAPAFDPAVENYTVNLAMGTTDVPTLTATATMNGYANVAKNEATEFVNYEAVSTVVVTSEDLSVTKTYTVHYYVAHQITTLVDVTESTVWDWTTITARADGSVIDQTIGTKQYGPSVATADGLILANYVLGGDNWDKIEGNDGAYAIRSSSNQFYQGASLHFHSTKGGYLTIRARNEGHDMILKVQNAGRDMNLGDLGDWKNYVIYVKAGDVVIYNVPASNNYPMRVAKITFTEDETPDYPRVVTNNFGTLCVDHNVVAGGALGATFYQIASRNELYNDKIDFEEVLPGEELKAGEPYIFQSTTGTIELYYGETVKAQPVEVRGMIGSFVDAHVDIDESNKSDILYIANNRLWNCEDMVGSYLEVVANRAYIVMSDVPTYAEYTATPQQGNAPRRRVTLGKDAQQNATGLENLVGGEQAQKLIIDGQMYILRGEKLYDATGRLVK